MPRKRTYRIAVAQLRVSEGDMPLNSRVIIAAIERAADEGAHFLLTPEMALTGYNDRFDQRLRDGLAHEIQGACRRTGVTAVVGSGDKRRGKTYIEQLIIDGRGRLIGRHSKMVLARGDRRWAAPGRTLRVFRDRGLTFGGLICNDLWVTPGHGADLDPRLTLKLSRLGARVVFHSIYSGMDQRMIPYHESNVSLRAQEGNLFIATANAERPRSVNCSTGIMAPDGEWLLRCRRRGRQFAVGDVEVVNA